MKVYQWCRIGEDPEGNLYDQCEDVYAELPENGYSITKEELERLLSLLYASWENKDHPLVQKFNQNLEAGKQLYIEREVIKEEK